MTQYVNVAGVWKTVDTQYVKVGGVWKSAGNDGYVNVGGVWKSYKPKGPYQISYVGYNTITFASNSANFDIGIDYADRIVFVGYLNRYTGASSVSVGGVAATKKAGFSNGSTALEWWAVVAPPGRGSVNVTATHAGGYMNTTVVYVLKGGAGLNPTYSVAQVYQNNQNTVTDYFSDDVKLNDIAIAIGMKAGVLNKFGSFGSNITPLVNNANISNVSDGGGGWALIGPATNTIATGGAYIQATGADSSKPNAFCAIKFSKA